MFKVGDKVLADDGHYYADKGVVKKITPVPFSKTLYGVWFKDEKRLYWFYPEHLTKLES